MQPRHYRFWPQGLPHRLERSRLTLHGALEATARRVCDKPLTHFFGSALSYREALEQIDRLAGWLQRASGLRRGERVLIDLQNSPQFILACGAILRADGVAVPVSPANLADELAHYVEDSGARAAIVGQEVFALVAGLVGRTPLEHVLVAAYSDYADPESELPQPEVVRAAREPLSGKGVTLWADALAAGHRPVPSLAQPDDLCVMPYTSGSTGHPKGCMHTHASVMHNVLGATLWESMREGTVALATAPMFHVTGFVHSYFGTLVAGGSIVLQPRWDPHLAARLIERHRCTHWANVPTMVVDLLSHPQTLQHDVSSLECIFGGGAAMPEAIAQKLHETCGIHYLEGYGMTETISQTHINPANHPKRQCLGIPTFDTESLVVDPESFKVLVPGEAGEIVVRGPQLLIGYWGKDKAFRESWVEIEGKPFFRTGDLGRMDEEGYYFISDRLKRMINAAGFKVWPAEIEAAMYRHPAIQECCIVASPDERRGETVKICVVLRPEARGKLSAEEILGWARGQMAAYKAPRKLEFLDALPRSGSGKIQWRSLQDKEFRTEGET